MAKKQFKAESKRLLDLMINSIYTHKEIFLREIISNASDACDKLHYRSLTDASVSVKREDLVIRLAADKEKRTLTVADNGIGIAAEDLPRVFERGYTGKNGRLERRSTGIGLFLCREVCRRLGHGITIASRPGEGTEVRLDLHREKLEVE